MQLKSGPGWFLLIGCTLVAFGIGVALVQATKQAALSYIGPFAENLPKIISLISRTDDSLTVVADHAGYGSYSERPMFEQYRDAILLKAKQGKTIKMVVYADDTAERSLRAQIADFPEERKKPRFKALEKRNEGLKINDVDAFIFALLTEEKAIRMQFRKAGVKFNTVSTLLPVFVWNRDMSEAIFSVYNLQDSRDPLSKSDAQRAGSEYSLHTSNRVLVRQFLTHIYEDAAADLIPNPCPDRGQPVKASRVALNP